MSRLGSCKATPAVRPGSYSCKATTSAPSTFRLDSKSDKLGAPRKGTPAHSHTSAPIPAESILALKYSKADLIRILKIFSEIKGQEPKAEVPSKQPLKAKVPNVYFEKSHMGCYHFCQQYEDYFETNDITRSNYTPFAASFLHGKINF